MDIGIIGVGNMGTSLAHGLVRLGHTVAIANSRGPASLSALAAETGASPMALEEAARSKDIVIVSVPQKAVLQIPQEALAGTEAIVIDTGNYFPSRDGYIADIEDGLADSEWVASVLAVPVIKAFNNITAQSLTSRPAPADTARRVALSVAGDSPHAKATVLGLIDSLGFDSIDTGTLRNSWRQHPGTPAYCRDLDAEGLRVALMQADALDIARYRAEQDEIARPYFM